MSSLRRCPEGHEWEPAGDGPPACPVCARAAQPMPTEGAHPLPAAPLAARVSEEVTVAEPGAAGDEVLRGEEPGAPRVPGFEILGVLGRGGMGVVYKARQTRLNRVVALKMILAGGHAGPADLQRFRAEAEVIARLHHPHVVQIYSVGEQAGRPFFALEFVDGGSLAQKLDGRPLPPAEAAALVEKLAQGIHAAHAAGIVHRDLKPANVLLAGDGTPKITDFGLAKRLGEPGALATGGRTQTGAILGTPSYMAPEQAQAKKGIGPAADVYALGAILYECLTGRPPFKAPTALDTVLEVIAGEVVPVRRLQPRVPRDLETICLKCLDKDPQRRYSGARALAEDLRRFLAGEPILARRAPAWERGWRWLRRRPAVLGAAVLLVAALTAAGFFYGEDAHRFIANRGRLVVEGEENGRVLVRRDGRQVAVVDLAGERQVTLDAGEYEAELEGDPDGVELSAGRFTLTRNGVETIEVRKEFVGELRRIDGHGGPVVALALSPDGKTALSGSRSLGGDGTLRLWDLAEGKVVRRLGEGKQDVMAVALSPDGTRALSGGSEGVRLWDAGTGREIRTFSGHKGDVRSVAFSPDGRRALTVGADGAIFLWDVESGAEVLRIVGGHAGGVWAVRFSPDGRKAVSGGADRAVRLWDLDSGKELKHFRGRHGGGLLCVAFSPDGRLVASGGEDLVVRVWDAETGRLSRRLRGHAKLVTAVAFTPDGKQVVSASADRTVRVWDLASGQERCKLARHTDGVLAVAVAADGRHALTAGGANFTDRWSLGHDYSLRWWALPRSHPGPDADSARKPAEVAVFRGHTGDVQAVAFSPDGTLVLSASGSPQHQGSGRLWDPETGAEVRHFALVGYYRSVAFTADGKQALTATSSGLVQTWDVATAKEISRTLDAGFNGANVLRDMAFSPDGKQALAASNQAQFSFLLDTNTGRRLRGFTGHTGLVECVALSADGTRALSGSQDRTMRLWDTKTGNELRRFTGHTRGVSKVVFSPDGQQALSGGQDGTVRLWDLQTGEELLLLMGHEGTVHGLAFSPDGRRAVSGGQDRTLRLWDLDIGEETLRLTHEGEVLAVAFGPDGSRVAAACKDATVHVWEVPPTGSAPPARGQVVIDTDTPAVPVVLKGQGRVLRAINPQAGRPASVLPGTYTAEPAGKVVGLRIEPREFALEAGGTQKIEVRRGPEYAGEVRRLEGGHPARWAASGLTFTPGGGHLLYAGQDGRLHRVEVPDGKEVADLPGEGLVHGQVLILSPDGRRAAVGTAGAMQVRDVEKGTEVCRLPGAQGTAAFLPGGRVLTGSVDGDLRLWDVDTGKELRRFDGHGTWGRCLAVARDGKRVLAGHADGFLRLWDMESGEELRWFSGHRLAVSAVALSPDGRLALSAGFDGAVRLWDADSGKEVHRLVGYVGTVLGLAFTPDSRRALAWGQGASPLVLWEVPGGRKLYSLGLSQEGWLQPTVTTATTRGAALAAWSGQDGAIHLWQIPAVAPPSPARDVDLVVDLEGLQGGKVIVRRNGQIVDAIPNIPGRSMALSLQAGDYEVEWDGGPRGGELSPSKFTLAGGGRQLVGVRRGPDFAGAVRHVFPGIGGPALNAVRSPIVVLPDGRHCLTDRGDGVLVLYELETGRAVRACRGHAGLTWGLALTPDGERAVSAGPDGSLRVWDVSTGRERTCCPDLGSAAAGGLALTPDGRQALCGLNDRLLLVDLTEGKVAREWAAPAGQGILRLALSPDGKRALTGHGDGSVILWDVAAGKEEHSFPPHAEAVSSLAFSPDGRLALFGCAGGPVRLWDVNARKELCRIPFLGRQAGAVAFTPDGRRCFVSCGDGFTRVVDVAQREEVYRFQSMLANAGLVFTDGGRRVILGNNGGLSVWQLPGPDHDEGQLLVESRGFTPTVLVKRHGQTVRTLFSNFTALCDLKEGDYELELPPGIQHGVTPAGLRLSAERVSIKAGRQQVVRVYRPVAPLVPPDPGRLAKAEEELKALLAREADAGADRDALRADLVEFVRNYRGLAPALEAAGALRRLPSPLDHLEADKVPAEVRALIGGGAARQAPAGLVAVLGDTRMRHPGAPANPGTGHHGAVRGLAFRGDGAVLATGGADGQVILWDTATGKELRSWAAHPGGVAALAFSPDGKTLATGGEDGRAVLWDAAAGKKARVVAAHEGAVRAVAFNADGQAVAAGRADGKVYLTSADGGPTVSLPTQGDAIVDLAFSPDGCLLVGGFRGGMVQAWDGATGASKRSWAGLRGQEHALAFSPDGSLLAGTGWGTVPVLWEGASGTTAPLLIGHRPGELRCVAFRPDGREIAAANANGNIILWDVETGREIDILTLRSALHSILQVAYSPDGRHLAVSHNGGLVSILRLASAQRNPASGGR